MAQIDVINRKGEVVGSIELNDAVFAIEPNQQALFDAIIMQQAGKRQGTAATKGRSQVSGGGRKPYRQAAPVRVPSVLRSTVAAERCSVQRPVTTPTKSTRRYAAWP